jgi:uncharacterized protein (DUF58 family)
VSFAATVTTYFQRRFSRWLERRMPKQDSVTLNRNRIFIFPSRAGFAYIALIILLWLVATNYQNNIVFGFAALLGSVFVVAIWHSYMNLSGLQFRIVKAAPTYAGDVAEIVIRVSQSTPRLRDHIALCFAEGREATLSFHGPVIEESLYVKARQRGWLNPGRLRVESSYPLGLFRVWTYILLTSKGVVYPLPIKGHPQLISADGEDQGQGTGNHSGSEDFAGIDNYRLGESRNHIAWKQVARSGRLLSKRFDDPPLSQSWVDWDAFPGLDREARLSRLCAWLLEMSQKPDPFGLRLPGYESQAGEGSAHLAIQLEKLALFEIEEGA